MIRIRNDIGFSEYEVGYKVFLYLEYVQDFARLVDFLQTGEIDLKIPGDGGWRKATCEAEYETLIYNDTRLGILGAMMGTAGAEAKCISAFGYPLMRSTYLRTPRDVTDIQVEDEEKKKSTVGARTGKEKKKKSKFEKSDPISVLTKEIGNDKLENLGLKCKDCPRSGVNEEGQTKSKDKDSLDKISKKRGVCSIYDACHLHSCAERTTSQLFQAIEEMMAGGEKESDKKKSDIKDDTPNTQ